MLRKKLQTEEHEGETAMRKNGCVAVGDTAMTEYWRFIRDNFSFI